MRPKVYFIETKDQEETSTLAGKLNRLLVNSNVFSGFKMNSRSAVKLHFGEEKNTGFVHPLLVKQIVDELGRKNGAAFLTDTNTLYSGRRTASSSHLQLAAEHGFTEKFLGADIEILDENLSNIAGVKLSGEFVDEAKVISNIVNADSLVGVAHFKGHIMTGFGGAIKNIGMGCASREGKLSQHADVNPVVRTECIGCSECVSICPGKAISISKATARIDPSLCIGCASCIAVCRQKAIDVQWEQGARTIQQKMAEYALAAILNKRDQCAFLNFAIKITKECDCLAQDDPRECPDVGIFASTDPVAIDKACVDAVNESAGKDLFRDLHPLRDYSLQLDHGEKIGLGKLDYELIKI